MTKRACESADDKVNAPYHRLSSGNSFVCCGACYDDVLKRGTRIIVVHDADSSYDDIICVDCLDKKDVRICHTCWKYNEPKHMSKCHTDHCKTCDPNDGKRFCRNVCAHCNNKYENKYDEFYKCRVHCYDEFETLCQRCMERGDYQKCMQCKKFSNGDSNCDCGVCCFCCLESGGCSAN